MPFVADLTARRLLAVVATEQRDGRAPSVVVALTRDGSLAWRGHHGESTGEPGLRPTELQYRIGSITKVMTAVLVLQLRDEGRLSLHHPVSAYLPELGSSVAGDASLRQLLAHAGGLPAEPEGAWWERSEGRAFRDLVTALDAAPPPLEAGATHHYSNLGYALLGEVVARLAGCSWWEQLSLRVLEPLGMLRTTYDPFPPHARGYSVAPYAPVLTDEPATDTGAMAPAGQVWSTVLDLATLSDFLVMGDPGVLSHASLREMTTPQVGTARGGLRDGYGLGLRLVPGGSGTLVGHTGSMPGFQAALLVDRARRTGAVVLANSTTGFHAERLAVGLLATLEACEPTVPEPWEPVAGVPPAVGDVLGVWHWGNTPLVLEWDGSRLQMLRPGTTGTPGQWRAEFALVDDRLVGTAGYHHGEPLDVVRRDDGSLSHLEVSTFVLTRTPYDPAAPIPGGAP